MSLRHISLSPQPGIHISIGKIGVSLRRSTVARPGWVSLNMSNFDIVFDSKVVLHPDYDLFAQAKREEEEDEPAEEQTRESDGSSDAADFQSGPGDLGWSIIPPRTFLFYVVRFFIKYANFYDFYATSTSITYTYIGSLILGNMAFRLDWRNVLGPAKDNFVGTLDSYQLKANEIPAHGRITVTDLYIAEEQEGQDPREILDSIIFDVEGIVGKKDLSVKELSFAVRLGKGVIYTDRMIEIIAAVKKFRQEGYDQRVRSEESPQSTSSQENGSSPNLRPGSPKLAQGILSENDLRNLTKVGTLLVRVVKEFAFKCQSLSVYGFPFVVADSKGVKGNELTVAAIAKDITLDLRRLNPNNPGFKLFFSESHYAHQALLTIGSTAVGIDNGVSQEEIVYIPIITMICRTNIFSKTLQLVKVKEVADKSESIVRANVHVTTPTLNLEAHHVPFLLHVISFGDNVDSRIAPSQHKFSFSLSSFQRLWPNATIRLTVEEPAARVLIPTNGGSAESSMVIYSSSKVYLDFETCHSLIHGNLRDYTVNGSLQISSYETWYRSPSGVRYDIFSSENLVLKAMGSTYPVPTVQLSGKMSNAHVLFTNYEIFNGIREVFLRLRKSSAKSAFSSPSAIQPQNSPGAPVYKPSFLRRLPPWLTRVKLEVADTAVSIASERVRRDDDVLRGLTLRVSNSLVEYRSEFNRKGTRKHPDSRHDNTDWRKLAIMMEGIEGYKIIEPYGLQHRAENRFLETPSMSVAFSTQSFETVPILQCNMLVRTAVVTYDLNLHFLAVLLVGLVQHTLALETMLSHHSSISPKRYSDFMAIQVKTENVRIKADLPNNAKIMLETNSLEAWRKPESNSRVQARAIKLYSRHPNVENSWCIISSLKNVGIDYNERPTSDEEEQVLIKCDAMRLNIPNQFMLYKIFDNIATAAKTIVNLYEQHQTKDYRLVIKPKERKIPLKLPRIRVKSPVLLMSLEADHFESELALIFKVGVREQKERLDREKFFDEKTKAINEKAASKEVNTTNSVRSRNFTNSTLGSTSSIPTSSNGAHSHGNSSITSLSKNGAEKEGSVKSAKPVKQHSLLGSHPFKLHHRNLKGEEATYSMVADELPDDSATVSIEEARQQLLLFNSTSWIKKFKDARESQRNAVKRNFEFLWGSDEIAKETVETERIVGYSDDPLLFYTMFRDIDLKLGGTQFTVPELKKYLHDIGKGIPEDTKYSLLLPLAVDLRLSELRIQLSDFPLPLLHFPDLQASQNPSIPSVTMKGNFVIAEILRENESNIRSVMVPLVPAALQSPNDPELGNYIVKVCRTVESVKMYTDLHFEVNSANPTRISWANSIQPTLLTAMIAFDSFSKPPIDPSPKLGFWDKIRSVFHSRMSFKFNGGDVFLLIKGSRSPYELLEDGSGFAFVWKGGVKLQINGSDDPKQFFVVTSEQFVWGVPNLAITEREYIKRSMALENAYTCRTNFCEMVNLQKVVLKLSGAVKWKLGLLFEKDKEGSLGRTSKFKPHYAVQLKHPDYVSDPDDDAYEGFRSRYIHLGIGVSNPGDKDWIKDQNSADDTSYNSVHLSPRSFRHFSRWWDLFDSALSLPVRNGTLFQEKRMTKPKFGHHLYTIQYQLALAPVFICHVYRHPPHSEDLIKNNKEASTGLKAKIDNFMMDLHQRREPVPGQKRWKMKLHLGQLDFKSTDLRVVQAEFKEKSSEELLARKLGVGSSPSSSISQENSLAPSRPSVGKFKVTDDDYTWIDLDDFVELAESWHVIRVPKIVVLPFLYSPQFTYFRQTDKDGSIIGKDQDWKDYVKFGNLVAHQCLIGERRPELVQTELIQMRIDEIDEQLKTDDATVESLQKDLEQYPEEEAVARRVEKLKKEIENLNLRKYVLAAVLMQNTALTAELASEFLEQDDLKNITEKSEAEVESILSEASDISFAGLDELVDVMSKNEFSNRFIFHNLQLKWNNAVRNAVYWYIHWVETRRRTVYYTTRRAIKYVEDLIEKANTQNQEEGTSPVDSMNDALSFVSKTCNGTYSVRSSGEERLENFEEDLFKVSEEERGTPYASYLFKLISPQIQLVSDKNPERCLLVTSKSIELKTVDVIDVSNDDEESALIENRFGVLLEDAQFYVFKKEAVLNGALSFFSNLYGNGKSGAWPPWLNIECCYSPSTFQKELVVDRTSVVCRYDRPNALHVIHNASEEQSETNFSSSLVRCEKYRHNRVCVDFPKVVATCDSDQYFAIYTIVVDLLIYSEPTKKQTSERLDRVLLTTNFSDLDKAVDRLNRLQRDLRSLYELRDQFYINQDQLDDNALHDLLRIDVESKQVALELQVMMAAIRSGLNRGHDEKSNYLKWAIGADQIIWHVLSDDRVPFLDIGLADASFNRLDGPDGFNANSVEVGMMQGFNLTPNSLYPELFSPLSDLAGEDQENNEKLISIRWTMLGPIGGIPIMESFEVKLQPLKLQLENATGRRIFEYVFPASKTESPFIVPPKTKSELEDESDTDSSDEERVDIEVLRRRDVDEQSLISNSTRPSTTSQASRFRSPGKAASFNGSTSLFKQDSHTDSESSVASSCRGIKKSKKRSSHDGDSTDDVALMMKRASNYMSIVEAKFYATSILFSYKVRWLSAIKENHEY